MSYLITVAVYLAAIFAVLIAGHAPSSAWFAVIGALALGMSLGCWLTRKTFEQRR